MKWDDQNGPTEREEHAFSNIVREIIREELNAAADRIADRLGESIADLEKRVKALESAA